MKFKQKWKKYGQMWKKFSQNGKTFSYPSEPSEKGEIGEPF